MQLKEGSARAGGPVSVDRASADVDVLCLVPRGLCISELPEKVIRPALRRQLAAMRAAMLEEGSVCDIRALHFQPPPWPHPVTVIYPLQAAAGKVRLLPSFCISAVQMRQRASH